VQIRFRKYVVAGAAVAILGIVSFVLVGAVFCQATLLASRRIGPAPPNAEPVSIIADDKATLSAWWLRPSSANGNCVIVLHGIADSRVSSAGFAPMFHNEGYAVLAPDSRAHGASGGQFVTYGLLERHDVIAWAAWMKNAGCRKLYGLGESLGASILIQAAAIQPAFAAIVAECPYADLQEVARYRVRRVTHAPAFLAGMVVNSAMLYARWADGLSLSQVSPVSVIGHVTTPILLIHGLKDDRTPPYNSEQLAQANPQDVLWLVPKAGHTGAAAAEPDEFRGRVLAWFAEH
jgi:fermentation-respiration switch protein FrsA (DUF1100 family)